MKRLSLTCVNSGAGKLKDERGFATVWATGAIAALLSLFLLVLWCGCAVLAKQRVGTAADLAALAAATKAVQGEAVACEEAGNVARRMATTVLSCRIESADALVELGVRLPVNAGESSLITARARAGPV